MTQKFNTQDSITVKTPLWWELPQITLRKKIGSTEYSISGSYDGNSALPAKLLQLLLRELEENR